MWGFFAAWLIAWVLITVGVIFYLKKKGRKRDLTKFTIIAGLLLAVSLGAILLIAMKMQINAILN